MITFKGAPTLNLPVQIVTDSATLPTLVDRASQALAGARNAAEILEAREMASFAYDVAKRTARLATAKGAHDELVAAAHRAQAGALEIEAGAKRRLADEYDAAQERREIAGPGGERSGREHSPPLPTTADIGISRKEIHEARQVRDAEEAEPGIVARTNKEELAAGREPTRAKVKQAVRQAIGKANPPLQPTRGKEAIALKVREAITALAGLPPAAEVVGYFNGTDHSIIIDEKLATAVDWLVEFAATWETQNA